MPCGNVGPGPGAYNLPSTVGYDKHDYSKYRNPNYSFGLKPGLTGKGLSPGPKYDVAKLTQYGKSAAPQYSMAPRLQALKQARYPGPGTYSVEKVRRTKEPEPPAWSLKSRTHYKGGPGSPGPAAYMLPTTLGPKVPDKNVQGAYTMAPKMDMKGMNRSPGPAAYGSPTLDKYKPKNPNYSMAPALKYGKGDRTPGPAGYFPKLSRKDPGYSFGVRHTPCEAQLILPDDNFPC